MTNLKDRLVLVTGGHRGIGAACARAFAAAGARVACADLRKPDATVGVAGRAQERPRAPLTGL